MLESVENSIDLTVPVICAGLRLDQTLARLLPEQSRSRLQSWILGGQVIVDGLSASPKQKMWGGERVKITPQQDLSGQKYSSENIPLNILHEDDTIIIVNKPAGLVVHPGSGNWGGTLLNALLHHYPALTGLPRVGIVHRLDKDTTGLMVVAKTHESQTSLVRQLQSHSVKRDYLALVQGQVSHDGLVDAPVGRHPVNRIKMSISSSGKEARTHYRVIDQLGGCTLLLCSLETGRTHQIRVHMQSLGHPLVGDQVYGGKPSKIDPEIGRIIAHFPRQALHAQRLELTHPKTNKDMSWESPLPDDMERLLSSLRQHRDSQSKQRSQSLPS
jgi:23S rRNA pseudouridine1911/1915/1917 synthase